MNESKHKVKHNLISGILYQIILVCVSFVIPSLCINKFGSEVNGVLATIKQIFTYMCLLETGVGMATTQALYKYVAEDNKEKINTILSATKIYYTKTGLISSAAVVLLAFIYSLSVKTPISPAVLFCIIILYALPTVLSYFIWAKYRILMEVDGRKYVINNGETALQIVSNGFKIAVLLLSDSLVLFQLAYTLVAIAQLIFLYIYAKKKYPWLNLNEKPDFGAIRQKNSVLVHQISAMIFNNTDVILISSLVDFKVASVYTIYNMFFTQVQSFITSVISGFTFALGQIFQTDRQKFDRYFRAYETVFIAACFAVFTLMASFLLPLIKIYVGNVTDVQYVNPMLLLLFVFVSFLSNAKLPVSQVIEFAGEFKNTRSHALWETVINLGVSVPAIIKWGVCGALTGTCVALIYRSIMVIGYANRKVLCRSMFDTYRLYLINGCIFAVVMIILPVDRFFGVSFVRLLLHGIMNAPWIIFLFASVNFIFDRQAFTTFLNLCRRNEKK